MRTIYLNRADNLKACVIAALAFALLWQIWVNRQEHARVDALISKNTTVQIITPVDKTKQQIYFLGLGPDPSK